jgi:hypothetical protein
MSRETIPFGDAVVLGDVEVVLRGEKRGILPRAILIQFESDEEMMRAVQARRLAFGLLGETREEVERR